MKARSEETADAARTVESLELELERCQSELEACRLRVGTLQQAEALLAGENRLLEIVAKGDSLPSILDGICRLVEQVSSGSLCSILLLDDKGGRLWHAAAPSLPASYTRAFDGGAIGPGAGPCGRAAYHRAQAIVCDIATDPSGEAYRDVALAHGLRACWSTPILSSEGKVLGTFAVLSRQPRSPTPQQREIIEQITHLAAVAIERKRTEAALHESEERFRRMADTIPEVIWFTSLDPEKVLYVSPSFERIWGVPVGDLYRNPRLWLEAIHPADRERVTSTFLRWIGGEQVDYQNLEYRIVQPGGAVRWILERGVLSFDKQGKANLASGISTDITERKHAEQELRRSEAYLAEAQKLSRTGSFGWNISSGELNWSQETFCIMGYDRTVRPRLELVLKRVHPDDTVLVQQTMDRAIRDQTDFDFEHRLLMPDESVKHVHVVARPARTESGEVEFVGAVMDVTERKISQEVMRTAKARFEGILEIAEDAIISVDTHQRIVLFNQGAENVFGYAASEVIGKPLDILLPQRFARAHKGHIEEFGLSPDVARPMGQRREVFGLRKDGHEFPAEASISKLDLGGDLVFTVILRDITERKQAAEALRASEHLARGQLDALAHTLDAMAEESDPDKLLEHAVRTIVEQCGAHSVSVWVRPGDRSRLERIAVIEEGRFVNIKDGTDSGPTFPSVSPDHPAWSDVFRTRQHAVLEDLERESAAMCVGSGAGAIRHRVLEDTDPDPAVAVLKKYLRGLGVRTILFVPMLVAGEVAGIVGIRFTQKRSFRQEEIELTRALAHQAMLGIQLMRLSRQRRQVAVTAERNRMARDIHDTLAQGFTGVIVQLEAAADATSKGLAKEAEEHLGRAGDLARESLREARRSVRALRPLALEERDLCEALEALTQKLTAGTTVQAEFVLQGEPRTLPAEWDENLLRIGQEVLTNVLRHAHASHFQVRIEFTPKEVRLELRDNGCGFDPAARHDGFGLLGIRERVEGIGGQITIQSSKGAGTAVVIALPLITNNEVLEP